MKWSDLQKRLIAVHVAGITPFETSEPVPWKWALATLAALGIGFAIGRY